MKIVEGMSPMMRHYLQMKEQYPDCFLFYRLGDFYEMFFEDAIEGSKIMELTLTGRDCGLPERAPMCGVPYHSVDTYVQRLISRGYKVAICEQMEDPALAKGLVERSVIRVITPGTVIEEKLLDAGKNNYLLSVYASSWTRGRTTICCPSMRLATATGMPTPTYPQANLKRERSAARSRKRRCSTRSPASAPPNACPTTLFLNRNT